MEKLTYAELVQNGTCLIRELNESRLKHSLKRLGLSHLRKREGVRFNNVITNVKKPVGNVFEGSL
jgi:hypothetical protein